MQVPSTNTNIQLEDVARFIEEHPSLTYLALTCLWCTLIFAVVAIVAGDLSMLLTSVLFGVISGGWTAAWQVGPLASLDARIVRGLQDGSLPDWMGWGRLLFVVLPYWFYGWVPAKVQALL